MGALERTFGGVGLVFTTMGSLVGVGRGELYGMEGFVLILSSRGDESIKKSRDDHSGFFFSFSRGDESIKKSRDDDAGVVFFYPRGEELI